MNTTTTTTTIKRVTKAQRFADIKALLSGETPVYGSTVEDVLAFCDNELNLLAKKNSGDKKPTAKQTENEHYKALILEFLAAQTEGVLCSDILKGIPELSAFQIQKVTSLVTPMVKSGQVIKTMYKNKAYISLPNDGEGEGV